MTGDVVAVGHGQREELAGADVTNAFRLGNLLAGGEGSWYADRWPGPRGLLHHDPYDMTYSIFVGDPAALDVLLAALPASGPVSLVAVEESVASLLRARLTALPLRVIPCHRLVLRDVSRLEPGGSARRLRPADAERVDRHWPFRSSKSLPYLRRCIERRPSAGIDVGGELVCWALAHSDLAIGMVHTLDAHRRRGRAGRVVSALATFLLKEGHVPFCHVARANLASIRLFEGLGFVKEEEVAFMKLRPGA